MTFTEVTGGQLVTEEPIVSVESPTASNTIKEGAIVKAVYVELWITGSGIDDFFTIIMAKLEGGFATPSFTNMANLHDYTNKKNILYTTQGLAPNDGVSGPVAIHRGWVKIPKGKQRFGLGDKFIISVAARMPADDNIEYCGFATYKEYS